ncbi:helix-turn-helix domain-containing protein [Chitinophaga sp. GCM10012297]|uniref:Helix-turn-helix transcriptional regulator n=1 Tax=Chitinophaga chungangae TaxID=2821488 RepID=A0ABS3YIE3_9BACT|nr:helix-turn-helix transcriptional regulator [Chitinophaga chungangae]MBO9154073.1 helix-turn-helix transcriptional regulator [Chitinophaga chungangae]
MSSFGKKLRECRDAKGLSQSELAKLLNTNHSIIGKYEREEVKPTIDVVKRLAEELETTVGFLLGETKQVNVLKDPAMLKRLNDIDALPETDKQCILYAIDGLLRDAKTRAAYK